MTLLRTTARALSFTCLLFAATFITNKPLAQNIEVGQNVQVSASQPTFSHTEVMIAVDPNNPANLIAASMFLDRTNVGNTVVYASSDGGTTWRKTLEANAYGKYSGDPDVAFGPDHTAYFLAIVGKPDSSPRSSVYLFRSSDGGLTWNKPTIIIGPPSVDRPYLAVDCTDNKHHGRLYLSSIVSNPGTENEPLPPNISLYHSDDQGNHFDPPSWRVMKQHSVIHPGPMAILSDGTIVSAYREFISPIDDELGSAQYPTTNFGTVSNDPTRPNNRIIALRSENYGESLATPIPITDGFYPYFSQTVNAFPIVAADSSNSPFKDRVYIAWTASLSGRTIIMLSYSSDKGKTWSPPKIVNDDMPFALPLKGPDDSLPALAVNPQGILGVMWYDRRDNPDNTGWYIRFAASLDGGDTFTPSVRVSDRPMNQDPQHWPIYGRTFNLPRPTGSTVTLRFVLGGLPQFSGGHTAGIAAGSNGTFHPLWVDNRTGFVQVWTAPITVLGRAIPNGSQELSTLKDISERTRLDFDDTRLDEKTRTITTTASLVNTSAQTLRGPIKVRVVAIRSDIARALKVANADNKVEGPGAVWTFTSLLNQGELKPGEKSSMKTLTFQFADLLPPDTKQRAPIMAMTIEARILGPAAP